MSRRGIDGRSLALAALAAVLLAGTARVGEAQVLEPDPGPMLVQPAPAEGNSPSRRVWQIQHIAIPERPVHILPGGTLTDLASIIVEGESGAWYSLADCAGGLCAELVTGPHSIETLPPDALPGSHVATGTNGILRAWLAEPTQRFDASAIGASVAATLVVEDHTTRDYRFEAGLDEGFEDLRPRIADIEGQGIDTIFTVKSSREQGASLIALRLEAEGLLRIVAATPPVGHPFGWLNPAGVADFTGEGRKAVAIVRTPGAEGQLQILDLAGDHFTLRFAVPGVNTYVPERTVLDMAVIADFDGDGVADIALPNATRQAIRILSFFSSQLAEPATIALPSVVTTEIAGIRPGIGGRPYLLMGLDDGSLVLLH